jgi:hypothetical protein
MGGLAGADDVMAAWDSKVQVEREAVHRIGACDWEEH